VGFIVSDRIEQQHTFVVLAKTHYWEWRSASLFEMCYWAFAYLNADHSRGNKESDNSLQIFWIVCRRNEITNCGITQSSPTACREITS